jgi:hypothetical protein
VASRVGAGERQKQLTEKKKHYTEDAEGTESTEIEWSKSGKREEKRIEKSQSRAVILSVQLTADREEKTLHRGRGGRRERREEWSKSEERERRAQSGYGNSPVVSPPLN